jgi:ferric-dicitrate binding protein FerR (iron transport regulator)
MARYLAGEATPDEQQRVTAWAASAPAHQAELARLQRLWVLPPPGEWNLDRAWGRVSGRLDRPARPLWIRVAVPLAASVVLVLGGLLVWRAGQVTPDRGMVPDVLATGAGERRELDLPDGSHITLAPESRIQVSAGYGERERRVDLTGEAWFVVTHDAARPFRVYAGGTVTEDLGTEFSVRTLAGDSGVRVVLVSGSASLRRISAPERNAVTLAPNDVAVIAAGSPDPAVTSDPAAQQLVSWRRGALTFSDARVDSVFRELSRWYSTRLALGDSRLAVRRFTGTLPAGDLDELIEILSLSLGATADRRDSLVILRPEP